MMILMTIYKLEFQRVFFLEVFPLQQSKEMAMIDMLYIYVVFYLIKIG